MTGLASNEGAFSREPGIALHNSRTYGMAFYLSISQFWYGLFSFYHVVMVRPLLFLPCSYYFYLRLLKHKWKNPLSLLLSFFIRVSLKLKMTTLFAGANQNVSWLSQSKHHFRLFLRVVGAIQEFCNHIHHFSWPFRADFHHYRSTAAHRFAAWIRTSLV